MPIHVAVSITRIEMRMVRMTPEAPNRTLTAMAVIVAQSGHFT